MMGLNRQQAMTAPFIDHGMSLILLTWAHASHGVKLLFGLQVLVFCKS